MNKHMQHWILPTLLLSTCIPPAMAAQSYDPSSFSGFYIGGDLGGSFSSAKEQGHMNANNNIDIPIPNPPSPPPGSTFPANTFGQSLSTAHRKNRLAAGLYAGYGYVCSQVYLGLEAFVNYSGYKTRTFKSLSLQDNFTAPALSFRTLINLADAIETRTKLQRWESGLDFRPGYFLTPCTLLYGRIGAGYNKLSLRNRLNDSFVQTATATILNNTLPLAAVLNENRTKKRGSLRLGLGLEQNICENFTIRADYVNTNYRQIHFRRSFAVSVPDGEGGTSTATFVNAVKISRIYNNAVTLGASYYW